MSKSIYDVSLADLLPYNLTNDSNIMAMCAAFDAMNQMITDTIDNVLVLADIGNQTSEITDILAIEQQTPYYNQTLSLEARRALVANTGKINSIKGTKAAVEQTVQAAFGSGTVQEWFEYEGQPGCFRVLVNDFPDSQAQMSEINRAIAATQRGSSHLDEVIIIVATTIAKQYMASTFVLAVFINTTMQAPN